MYRPPKPFPIDTYRWVKDPLFNLRSHRDRRCEQSSLILHHPFPLQTRLVMCVISRGGDCCDRQIWERDRVGKRTRVCGTICRKPLTVNALRKRGLEPPHPCEYQNLNLARLPIPPLPLDRRNPQIEADSPVYRDASRIPAMLTIWNSARVVCPKIRILVPCRDKAKPSHSGEGQSRFHPHPHECGRSKSKTRSDVSRLLHDVAKCRESVSKCRENVSKCREIVAKCRENVSKCRENVGTYGELRIESCRHNRL